MPHIFAAMFTDSGCDFAGYSDIAVGASEVLGIQLLKKQAVSTFLLIEFAWIFFRADSIADALGIIRHMFVWNPWILSDGTLYTYGLDYKDFRMAFIGIALSGVVDFFWIVIFGVYGATFDSSSFIYFQF